MNFPGMKFDVTDVIDVVKPIQEDSFNAATVLEDQGVTYTVIERGSQKGQPILVTNLGYVYSVKVNVSLKNVN
ncbi:hypothetical protein DPMN_137172 [Dreissena polymorpha]|nr:hypothetical protein DPMN_137172 [Dreissena polymorpha]